jgi:hypothetical protein
MDSKPGDLRLNIWLEHVTEVRLRSVVRKTTKLKLVFQGEKHRVIAYDSVVTIVEPERPFFDFQM